MRQTRRKDAAELRKKVISSQERHKHEFGKVLQPFAIVTGPRRRIKV